MPLSTPLTGMSHRFSRHTSVRAFHAVLKLSELHL